MRRQLVTLTFAGLAIATTTSGAPRRPATKRQWARPRPLPSSASAWPLPAIRDEAAMVLVGTALIGLGAAVRRAG